MPDCSQSWWSCCCISIIPVSGSAKLEQEGLLCNIGFDQVSGNLEGLEACAGKPRYAKFDMFAFPSEVLHASCVYTQACSVQGLPDHSLHRSSVQQAGHCKQLSRGLHVTLYYYASVIITQCLTKKTAGSVYLRSVCMHQHTPGMCRQQS